MKLFMALWLATLGPVFAGGQDGNGGNSCWLRHERITVSFEELLYPGLRAEEYVSRLDLTSRGDRVSLLRDQQVFLTLREKYRRVREGHKLLGDALLDALNVYRDVFVFRGPPVEGFYAGSFYAAGECADSFGSPRPAIVTFRNGGTVFVESTWNNMTATTQQIILIHETIRFLQMFHPALSSMTNLDIERFTLKVYEGESLPRSVLLSKFEKSLKNFIPPSPQTDVIDDDLTQVVKVTVQEYLKRGDTMSSALNHLRIDDAYFREELAKDVAATFERWRQR